MNTTVRKHPRTLQEAFGPYTDSVIHEPKRTIFPFARWLAEQKPDDGDSIQESAVAEHRSMQIPGNR